MNRQTLDRRTLRAYYSPIIAPVVRALSSPLVKPHGAHGARQDS